MFLLKKLLTTPHKMDKYQNRHNFINTFGKTTFNNAKQILDCLLKTIDEKIYNLNPVKR
jgi:hypothetical protein